jgi:urease gamma subunit
LHLTPHEQERLLLSYAAELARRRQARGLRLNLPEATALSCDDKTDHAPMVGADLDVMRRDSAAVRGGKPTLLISLREARRPRRPPSG